MSSLAAARADNYYYPKDWDPSKGSLNKFQKSHPLGQRAKKIKEGILVIRFEIPFHVRCLGCKRMIGKGVRFNAEKKCVGKFHSTRIWEFSFRCHLCPQKIVVRTDPENTDYKFVEGAYKILSTENATDVEFMRAEEEKKKIAENPFFKLENEVKDKAKAKQERTRLHDLYDLKQDRASNDYELNAQLRKKIRIEKKQAALEEEKNKDKRSFLSLPELTPDDKLVAQNAKFTGLDTFRTNRSLKREKIRTESIFSDKKNDNQELLLKAGKLPTDTKNLLKKSLEQQQSFGLFKPKINSISKE